MKPKKLDSVKITLKQNIILSGMVESWTSKKIVLNFKDDIIVISDPTQILFYLIEKPKQIKEITKSELPGLSKTIEERILDSTKSLVELKQEEAKLEKEEVTNKLRDLTFSKIGGNNYGIPDISKIKILK